MVSDKIIWIQEVKPYLDYSINPKLLIYYRDSKGMLRWELVNYRRKLFDNVVPLWMDYYIYNNVSPDLDKLKVVYFDLECKDTDPSMNLKRKQVLSAVFIDEDNNVFRLCDDDEERLLAQIMAIVKNYDIVIGYNSDFFDFPLLVERGKLYGFKFGRLSYKFGDALNIFKKFNNINVILSTSGLRSFSLDSLGQHFLGLEKIDIYGESGVDSRYGGTIYRLFRHNRDRLMEYNQRDVEILKGLCEKFDMIGTLKMMSEVSGALPQLIIKTMSACIETLLLKQIAAEGLLDDKKLECYNHILRKLVTSRKMEYGGALVLKAKPGLYKNVAVYDFKSLYPSIMRTFNLSIENTYNLGVIRDVDVAVLNKILLKELGLIPRILDGLQELRDKYKREKKKTKEVAVKLISNSFYGYFGGAKTLFKCVGLASSVTAIARFLLGYIYKEFGGIYGDTDSIFIPIGSLDRALKMEKIINDKLKEFLVSQFNLKESRYYFIMEFEKFFNSLILVSKKKYIGHLTFVDGEQCDKIWGKGIELVRRDYTAFGKYLLDTTVRKILLEGADLPDIVKWLRVERDKLFSGKVKTEDLALVSSVSKMPEEYKADPVHLRVSKKMVSRGQPFFVGQRISYIVTGRDGDGKLDGEELDYAVKNNVMPNFEIYWSQKCLPPILRILESVYGDKVVYYINSLYSGNGIVQKHLGLYV